MLSPSYSISPKDLWSAIETHDATQLVDVRRCDAYEQSPHLLPGGRAPRGIAWPVGTGRR